VGAVMVGVDPDPARKDMISAWAKATGRRSIRTPPEGAYVNFMMEEGEDRVRATYGRTTPGSCEDQERYDPLNLFR